MNPFEGEFDQLFQEKQVELVLAQVRYLIDGSTEPVEAPQNQLMFQEIIEILSDGAKRERNISAL